jgi:threonine/homoserine/homoserine lactone efflux protein
MGQEPVDELGIAHFLRYVAAGFTLCAPIGPIGLLCLKRSMVEGRLAGLISVLGASTMDGFYCLIAGLGVACLSDFLTNEKSTIAMIGGIALSLVGIKMILTKSYAGIGSGLSMRLGHAFFTTLLLMLTNPFPILVFAAVFASMGSFEAASRSQYIIISSVCVFIGSSLWGFILFAMHGLFRRQPGLSLAGVMNKGCGFILFISGLVVVILALVNGM